MDKPISVGDLVVVIAKCPYCGCSNGLGHTFVVSAFFTADGDMDCCGGGDGVTELCADEVGDEDFSWPLRFLKRIPPLDELESEKREESVNA